MMPLTLANLDEELTIVRVGGKPEAKKHLEDLGFTSGSTVRVITSNDGNLIVNVKDSRIALDRDMAMKIMV